MKITHSVIIVLVSIVLLTSGCSEHLARNSDAPFTIVMLPDTQNYADTRLQQTDQRLGTGDLRGQFYTQTEWIKANTETLDIAMVAHVGDIVQTDYPGEWQIADKAFRTIDDTTPYILSVGNHDMGFELVSEKPPKYKSAVTRKTLVNEYFPPSRFEDKPWYGGNYNNSSENYYCTFERAGMDFLIISLEFVPRNEVLDWANKVVASHPDHRTIMITHWYLKADGKRFTSNPYGIKGNNAEQMWQKFVSKHENIFMVLCGHVLGESLLTSTGEHGNTVHQILADYQGMNKGGNGYLRIMKFLPAENKIQIKTYSPTENKFITTPENNFTLSYNMSE